MAVPVPAAPGPDVRDAPSCRGRRRRVGCTRPEESGRAAWASTTGPGGTTRHIGYNLSSECWWSPNHPFTSSLTGQTCQELADQYEQDNDAEWTQPILHYAIFEVVADALKRCTNVDDKAIIRDAIAATDMQTIGGHIAWGTSDKKLNPVPNVCTTPIVGGQWVKGDQWPYNLIVVSNSLYPDIPTQATLQPISY